MPTTAAGTPYTVTSATVSGSTATRAVGDAYASDTDIPTILYCHGSGGGPTQFATTPAWTGLRDWIIDHGGAWVEGGGGPNDTAGETNWGNTGARTAYVNYLAWAAGFLDIGPVVVLGRSMGGLVAAWLYTQSSIAAQCVGLIVNSGVQTISYGTYDGAASERPTGQYFGAPILAAYGATDYADLVTLSHDHDPMNFDPALWTGKNVLQLVGTADTTVPPQSRGAYPLMNVYEGYPALDRLDVRDGGDHTQANGSYLQVSAMTGFLADCGAFTGFTPTEATFLRDSAHWYHDGGELFAMLPRYGH